MSAVVQNWTELCKGQIRPKHVGKRTNLYYQFISMLLRAKSLQAKSSIPSLSVGPALCWPDWGPATFLWEPERHYCSCTSVLEWRDCSSNPTGQEGADCGSWQQPEGYSQAPGRYFAFCNLKPLNGTCILFMFAYWLNVISGCDLWSI